MRLICLLVLAIQLSSAQTLVAVPTQLIEKSIPSVAMIVVGRGDQGSDAIGSALVVRESGVLLTAYHLIKDAASLQVRFKNGETFDDVQLLAFDARRDIAALKISAGRLPVLLLSDVADAKAGEPVFVLSHAAALPWSASAGIISAVRLADEVPGAGTGFRVIQFTASVAPGSSGGVVIDARGRTLGLVIGSLPRGQNLNFAIPLQSVIGLADSPVAIKTYGNGSGLNAPPPAASVQAAQPKDTATPSAPEKSDVLKDSKDRDYILRNFKTMYVDARDAQYFGSDQLKAALGRNKGFTPLNINVVDDPKIADTILKVSYTFAWDYPFELKHQNTTLVLIAGKGHGPFSGPAGAASVADQFVKAARPYRMAPKPAK